MNRRTFIKTLPSVAMLAGAASAFAEEAPGAASGSAEKTPGVAAVPNLQPIELPKPETDGGKSVLAALRERRTIRSISDKPLPLQGLSNLLWAAFGINRESGVGAEGIWGGFRRRGR